MNRPEVKLFVASVLFQEYLDEIEGKSFYKQRVKFLSKQLQSELSKLNSVDMSAEDLSLKINEATAALDGVLNNVEVAKRTF